MKTVKDFSSQKDFFAYLIANKSEIIAIKKSAMKFTDPLSFDNKETPVIKELTTSYKDDVASGIIKRTIICNTYNWMDSQNDVLLPGCTSKSISESGDKVLHLHDHEFKITSKVGKPTKVYEKSVLWKDLGVNQPGETICLMMDSNIEKELNNVVFNAYLNDEINQHSIGLNYVILDLAINDPLNKEAYAVWNKYINQIGNKDAVLEDGYFWAVKEIKWKENSCVIAGANELTPTLINQSKSECTTDHRTMKAGESCPECKMNCCKDCMTMNQPANAVCSKCGTQMQPKSAIDRYIENKTKIKSAIDIYIESKNK
ncbi:hypothetical protein UFOVP916_52 [uncultured Caudovirales phage]|uniref:Uncharacterized protein n=1 Tax=uncultured Caudovirales phage TaxID=2100421 RepID=A0A6J5RUD1_9CAUD|nr:hypothetical protein UFOVP827_7 [uncultured Caudovirales phage]CAB4171481.1 hypothetical protein UFOVP916_52 [uncultured Caudovirales phage]CAB4177285.1 hypothetical protein UFOVP1001_10 [uncultured Caudovirales phage]CAB4199572.1 hypothetical protein UFOVP1338_66 [uncultured Caudovirales phage]CAB4213571.1 hypothetical protein UFOVP1447_61 [uncultured Caudovirales phage]